MMSWTYQIFSWSSATLVTWFTPGKSLGTNATVPLVSSNIKHFHKLLSGIWRTAPKPLSCFSAPPGGCQPSIIKMLAWVVLLGSCTQKVKLLHSYYCKVITQSP